MELLQGSAQGQPRVEAERCTMDVVGERAAERIGLLFPTGVPAPMRSSSAAGGAASSSSAWGQGEEPQE